MTDDRLGRRSFLGKSAAGLAIAAMPKPSPAQGSANDRIQIGIIGPGGRGTSLMKDCIEFGSQYNARLTAVCDIWNKRLEAAAKLVRESYSIEPKATPRYEELLEDKDIDAVIIATPDFQHAKDAKGRRSKPERTSTAKSRWATCCRN